MNYVAITFKEFVKEKIQAQLTENKELIENKAKTNEPLINDFKAEFEKIMKEYDNLYK